MTHQCCLFQGWAWKRSFWRGGAPRFRNYRFALGSIYWSTSSTDLALIASCFCPSLTVAASHSTWSDFLEAGIPLQLGQMFQPTPDELYPTHSAEQRHKKRSSLISLFGPMCLSLLARQAAPVNQWGSDWCGVQCRVKFVRIIDSAIAPSARMDWERGVGQGLANLSGNSPVAFSHMFAMCWMG